MTDRTDYLTLAHEALLDYGDAFARGDLENAIAIANRHRDLLNEREDFHTREADLIASKLYDAGCDMAIPFYGRNAA